MAKKDQIPTEEKITRDAFPASKKIYVKGELHNIKVAMREIVLNDTVLKFNPSAPKEHNPPVTVYDTSGPYTDPGS